MRHENITLLPQFCQKGFEEGKNKAAAISAAANKSLAVTANKLQRLK
jgi:hypothetical protein